MIIIVEKQHLNKYDDNKVFFKKRVKTRISNTKVIPGNNDSPPLGINNHLVIIIIIIRCD